MAELASVLVLVKPLFESVKGFALSACDHLRCITASRSGLYDSKEFIAVGSLHLLILVSYDQCEVLVIGAELWELVQSLQNSSPRSLNSSECIFQECPTYFEQFRNSRF